MIITSRNASPRPRGATSQASHLVQIFVFFYIYKLFVFVFLFANFTYESIFYSHYIRNVVRSLLENARLLKAKSLHDRLA